jgi:hypothetical protein
MKSPSTLPSQDPTKNMQLPPWPPPKHPANNLLEGHRHASCRSSGKAALAATPPPGHTQPSNILPRATHRHARADDGCHRRPMHTRPTKLATAGHFAAVTTTLHQPGPLAGFAVDGQAAMLSPTRRN